MDASAAVRALVNLDPAARAWLDRAAWPSLVYVEVAHVLLRLARNGVLLHERAEHTLDVLRTLHVAVHPVETLVEEAWRVGLERGLSAYDACYVALAETLDLPLVTADRKLAASTSHAILLA